MKAGGEERERLGKIRREWDAGNTKVKEKGKMEGKYTVEEIKGERE